MTVIGSTALMDSSIFSFNFLFKRHHTTFLRFKSVYKSTNILTIQKKEVNQTEEI